MHRVIRYTKKKRPHVKLAFLLDQARFHYQKHMKDPERVVGAPVVLNVVSRPDLNGIEGVWALMKRPYRIYIDCQKANHLPIEQTACVAKLWNELDDIKVRRLALAGWK